MRTFSEDTKRQRYRPRVLLVETDVLLALDMEELLRDSGCEVVGRFDTVMEASAWLDSEPVDLAIVDYVLKDGTAELLATALDGKGIPFAICTGRAVVELSAVHPHTPILGKPYGPEDVTRVVNSLLAARLAVGPSSILTPAPALPAPPSKD